MKGVKGKFLKKLKSIKPLSTLKQADRILQANGFLLNSLPNNESRRQNQMNHPCKPNLLDSDGIMDVSMKDLEDEEMEEDGLLDGNKENIGPKIKAKDPLMSVKDDSENIILSDSKLQIRSLSQLDVEMSNPRTSPPPPSCNSLKEVDVTVFRRPDLDSPTLFDPNLLEAFQLAVMEYMRAQEVERKVRTDRVKEDEPPSKSRRIEEEDPFEEFEEKCPPGGNESVILYTTSLRGIRKTFEDCSKIKFLLGNFKIMYYERDISMHLDYREELWGVLGSPVVAPRLFVRGRYIGGADEVLGLHEQGRLLKLFKGMPRDQPSSPCDCCGSFRFILCYKCDGSRKVRNDDGDDALRIHCSQCNENGLIVCPFCC
ncbi:hypothetical protein MKW94_018153 [Papaver nudicaule]|uniref:Glutaredoxin domain-containing protein n=1 Tax=Papaver nudicaule TaxID=74823 RepID=A0AA41SK24_PAPNU|nr:hypothetical protein [Papaver nudicaule]MCL7038143.1 hypothetical protein [Papaver nudicaule]